MTIAFGIQMVRLAILVQMNRRTIPRLSIVIPTHQHLTQIATPVQHRWAVQIRHQVAIAQVQAAVQIHHQAATVQVQAAVQIRHQAATAQVQAAVQIRHQAATVQVQAAIVQVQAAVRRQVHRQVAVQARRPVAVPVQILILNQNVIAVMI